MHHSEISTLSCAYSCTPDHILYQTINLRNMKEKQIILARKLRRQLHTPSRKKNTHTQHHYRLLQNASNSMRYLEYLNLRLKVTHKNEIVQFDCWFMHLHQNSPFKIVQRCLCRLNSVTKSENDIHSQKCVHWTISSSNFVLLWFFFSCDVCFCDFILIPFYSTWKCLVVHAALHQRHLMFVSRIEWSWMLLCKRANSQQLETYNSFN